MATAPLLLPQGKGVQALIAVQPEVPAHPWVHLEVLGLLRALQEVLVVQGEDINSSDEFFLI